QALRDLHQRQGADAAISLMQRVPGKEPILDVRRRQIDIGNLAAIRFESGLKASGRSPRFVRTRLSTSQLRSCETAAILGRRFSGVFAKGGGKTSSSR